MVEKRTVKEKVEVQRVFVHCRNRPEDVMAFCRVAPHIRRIPHEIDVPKNPTWHLPLKLTLAHIPAPYQEHQWDLFWEDIDKLLSASLASRGEHVSRLGEGGNRYETEVWRWPSLLVTDSRKLVRALGDVMLRGILAEAARLKHWEILPIILWEDFKQLCGGLVVDAPIEAHAPFEDAEQLEIRHLAQPATREVEIGLGVYIQKRNSDKSPADPRFGARSVALFGNGQCAYSAVSSDGAREVECAGQWEIRNGVLVLGCDKGDPPATHLDLAESIRILHDVKYEEPVHLTLEEIEEFFEPAVHIAECIPRFSQDLRQTLLDDQWFHDFVDKCNIAKTGDADDDVHKLQKHKVCNLRPGRYNYERGPLVIEMLLHANGTYTYREVSTNGILKAVHRTPVWRVEDGVLILDISGEENLGFLWQKARQKRTVEQHVRRVEIPAQFILESFNFEAFVQQDDPFPDHVPVPQGRRVGGLIDPLSCTLITPALKTDRLPLADFEKQLQRVGVDVSSIVSDISMLDTDQDGFISQQELNAIDDYGREVAAPEVLDEFRQGLLGSFSSLDVAFQDMCQGSSDQSVSLEKFIAWIESKKTMKPDKKQGDEGVLRDWCAGVDNETLKLVFSSLDVERDQELVYDELETLHLHSAILCLHRVEHFCTFIKNTFGGCNETAYKRAYAALDIHKKKTLSDELFVNACNKHLGYPYTNAARAVFSMADRNFSKEVLPQEFCVLHKFKTKKFLVGLEDLKVMVEAKCGGLDRGYQFFLDEQKKMGGVQHAGGESKSVGFPAFESVCKKKGITQGCKGLDLKNVFIFLDEVTGGHASGFLTMKEWSLLHAFDARAVTGCPARLRKLLKTKYGNLDSAFDAFYQSWLPGELRHRLDMFALARVMHGCGHDEKTTNSNSPNRKSNIVEVRVGGLAGSSKKGESGDSISLGRSILADWKPMNRTVGPGPVSAWKPHGTWRLPGVISKPKSWPKDDGGRRAQTPRAGTVSAIDWGIRC